MELLPSFFENAFPTNVSPHLNQGAVVKVIGPGPILESKGKGQRTNKCCKRSKYLKIWAKMHKI